jgi:hypothetical protein
MSDYVHWSCLGALCEFLPLAENRVTLAAEKDRHGLPVARFAYSQCDNDRSLAKAAQQVMEDILHAAGADEVLPTQGSANPGLTIMAVAARAADHLIASAPGRSA